MKSYKPFVINKKNIITRNKFRSLSHFWGLNEIINWLQITYFIKILFLDFQNIKVKKNKKLTSLKYLQIP